MLPTDSNQRILQVISEADGPITLGLLPLTASEAEQCINQVVASCNGRFRKLIDLMMILTPAAAAYAIAAGASQAVTQGGAFWGPLSEKLQIDLAAPHDRERLSSCFQSTCRNLGIVDPDVSEMAWVHIAPMMAQASILHSWAESLARGVQTTIRHRPLPDLNDPRSLRAFARDLATHIHNQPNLRSILRTDVGSVVVHRMITSCVYDQFNILPSHLVEPIQAALQGTGRQISLKSPYASFSEVHGCLELVLPKQPTKLTTHNTHWLVKGCQYSPVTEQRLPELEIGAGQLSVELRELGEGYPSQRFEVMLGLDQPFRVFDQSSLRERTVRPGMETLLTPSDYLLVMNQECSTNDPDAEELRGQYRLLQQVCLRPGWEPLTITHDGTKSTLSPLLKAGIYQSSGTGLSTLLEDGTRLHYGTDFGLQAFIPKGQHSGSLKLEISSRGSILYVQEVSLQPEDLGVYDYSSALQGALQNATSELAGGIHPLRIDIHTQTTSVTRDLWHWKGLERISRHLGFRCLEPPQNIDFGRSRGIEASDRGCRFIEGYHAPRLRIVLSEGDSLEITRPGVQSVCFDPTDGWKSELTAQETLSVTETDRRVITFESGGFEQWSLRCNGQEFNSLDDRRTNVHIGLRSLMADYGRSGVIEAYNSSGNVIRLFDFSSDVVATTFVHEIDHGRGLHQWKTSIPTAEIGRLALATHDYSSSPYPVVLPDVEIFSDQAEGDEWTVQLKEGINLQMRHLAAEGNAARRLTLCAEVDPEKIGQQLLLIEWKQAAPGTDLWNLVHCVDGPSTSRLILAIQGGGQIEEHTSTWWHHLWRINQGQLNKDDLSLYKDITEDEIEAALDTISMLTSIKYPSSVYFESAKYFSSLSHKLSIRREAVGPRDDDVWWQAGAEELQKHAIQKIAPVVRQFLFSCNPHVMARQWATKPKLERAATGNIVSSLNLVNIVREAGGRVRYAQQVFHENKHPQELFTSFENFNQVLSGQSPRFTKFNFRQFLNPILERTLHHSDSGSPLDAAPILSARHLFQSIEALNRRVRILTRAADGDADHPLNKSLQALARARNPLEHLIHPLNQRIGYQPTARGANLDRPDQFEAHYFPDLPAMGSPQSKQIADMTWAICLLTRATAHGLIDRDIYRERIRIFSGDTVQTHLINLMLSFAPELFSYYTALFDFSLFVNPDPAEV
jgi:hypothetical protein